MTHNTNINSTPLRKSGPDAATGKLELRFQGLTIHELVGEFAFHPHVHSSYEVILVERGPYRCRANGLELSMGAEEFLVLKPGDAHADFCAPPLVYIGVALDVRRAAATDNAPFGIFKPGLAPDGQRGRIEKAVSGPIIEQFRLESERNARFSARIQDALMAELFWRLLDHLPEASFSDEFAELSSAHSFTSALTRLFTAHLTKSLSVPEMARHMRMGESSFAHRCVEVLGEPPAKAFARHKVGQAAKMLESSDLSVKAVSEFFGFSNQYHFSKLFKQYAGRPPSATRDSRE